ncbi:MAG: periplasmic heavy metal sensor [Desulfobacterales bacterium]|nr:MAG: periplasmic heavy metal sensor [Desulfobacterales bacterium]UCD89031.1 MAG: periplasmic heavy metal sensor [Desulfobacterales bacterium]
MLRNTLWAALVVLLMVAPTLVYGQHMASGKWWRIPDVAKSLNLSDKEVQQLEEAFRHSRRRLIQLKGQVESEQFELENLMDSKSLDDDAVHKQYERLEKARSDLGTERFRFLLKVRKIVGYERFQGLVSLKKRHLRKQRRYRKQNGLTPME